MITYIAFCFTTFADIYSIDGPIERLLL